MHGKARSALDSERYSLVKDGRNPRAIPRPACERPAALEGPMTPHGVRRENMVELIGIEPTTSGLQSPRSPS